MDFKRLLCKKSHRKMLASLCTLLSILHGCFSVDLTYYVEEGKSPGTFLGDIAADTHVLDTVLPQDHHLVTFSLLQQGVTGTSQLFRVSKKTGNLYTAQILDTESLCTYNTECFKMVDIAVRQAESFVKILEIKVIIKDVNDHQPEFPDKQVNIEFSERDGRGAKILIPNAIDRDVGMLNSQINYQLKKNKDEPFTLSVSQKSGGTSDLGITLDEMVDREVKDTYLIQVIAKDGGSPPKQSILDVHIAVTDVNDNTPVFSQNVYNVSIKNKPSEIIPIAIVSATDLDSGKNGKITYHFSFQTSSNVKAHFKLNEVTGEVFLIKKFHLGKELVYKLYIKATDGGSPPLSSTAKVQVNVVNQQNNAPAIDVNFVSASKDNTLEISEDIKVGSFIAYVKVTDHDGGHNGDVRCDLHHDKFQLQSLGTKKYKVTLKNRVDREIQDHHDIFIRCQDNGSPPLYSESKFSIKVLDVNDVRPQFSKETYKFWIYENQESKIAVGTINASDPDLGSGGKLTYSLLTNNRQFLPFQITNDGLITTIISLDHEFQDVYKFQVFVKDNGIPSLNNTVNVIVEVRDENDNSPYFTFPSVNPFSLDVVYYPHHTRNITVLKATDSDSRENAHLKYEITKGNDKQLFTINHYTGLLAFSRVVSHQDAGSYDLEFVVRDSGTPVMSATTVVFLTLTVSNKTSEMMNAVHIQTNDKINLNLAVIIVLVAVTVSVATTASMSVCILRCNNERNNSHRDERSLSQRYISEQRHLMCPSYQGSSWSDSPVAVATDSCKSRNAHLKESERRDSNHDDDFVDGEIHPTPRRQGSTENSHQVRFFLHLNPFFDKLNR